MPSCREETSARLPIRQAVNYYHVLDLSGSTSNVPAVGQAEIKQAYRHALLSNHPDKSQAADLVHRGIARYTVDEVTKAYNTLIDPKRRLEHDRQILLEPRGTGNNHAQSHPGIDTLDLDDLDRDESSGAWYIACRCGNKEGFTVTENELESSFLLGEIIAECQSCSLHLRLTFAAADEAV